MRNNRVDFRSNGSQRSIMMRPKLIRASEKVMRSSRHLARVDSSKAVTYCTSDHLSVMTQLYGSVWPRVFPFCVANTLFCAFIWKVDRKYDNIDLSIDPSGHKYLAALLSFLVIARVKFLYKYSIKQREHLSVITQNAHDLVENAAVLTHENKSLQAVEWRRNVALGVIELVRDCMDALSYNSDIREIMTKDEAKEWKRMSTKERSGIHQRQEVIRKEKFRKPTLSAMTLKKKILSHRHEYASEFETLIASQPAELRLLNFVDTCQEAFYKIEGQINTPFPFPMVQMARTILIFWLVSLPFALEHSTYPLWGQCMLIFLLTFGFYGLESVCIEMSDPFGTDANDFDQVNLARMTFEDIYLTIVRYDGHGEFCKVRSKANILMEESRFFRVECKSPLRRLMKGHSFRFFKDLDND